MVGRVIHRLLPSGSRRYALAKRIHALVGGRVPHPLAAHLRARQRPFSEAARADFLGALEKHLHLLHGRDHPDTPARQQEIENHVSGRLTKDRASIIPWLDAVHRLDGARVLEIGCGTGASTVALAEQGAAVVGVDIRGDALQVAAARCRGYGVEARLLLANATEVRSRLAGEAFDVIIFFASLEHMPLADRLEALRVTWSMLRSGAYLVVTDTPNRLWYYDHHTSLANFFHWLPDDLAILYASRTPREVFNRAFSAVTEDSRTELARWGRGVSFHDFALALDVVPAHLPVVSCMSSFFRQRHGEDREYGRTLDGRYATVLREAAPDIHPGFFEKSLDLILRKP
jgi:S-adenosylmethionine-dependent methyltransferase